MKENVINLKQEILKKLDDARSSDLVDKEVEPLLDAINTIEDAVTTSSCSGRFQLIQVPDLGDKVGSIILGKWHRAVDPDEVLRALEKWDGAGQLHLLVQPLLVHLRCRDLTTAVRMRNIAQEAGMKFSTIRSVKLGRNDEPIEFGTVVEFLGTERMEVPLHGIRGELFQEIIPPLVEHGNDLISRTKKRIPKMISSIQKFEIKRDYHN